MAALSAFLSDIGQRIVTVNKREQRRYLRAWLSGLRLPSHARMLDFGCGTGLFAPTLQAAGLQYHGYDPDADAVAYARRQYPHASFTAVLDEGRDGYDLILANCCFHHIADADLRQHTLPALARLLRPTGIFLLWDVLPLDETASGARRAYNGLEQGDCKRTPAQLQALVAGLFAVRRQQVDRFFALPAPLIEWIYNDLVMLELAPAPASVSD